MPAPGAAESRLWLAAPLKELFSGPAHPGEHTDAPALVRAVADALLGVTL
ncbi:MAG: hypothetical protein ACRDQH_02920 [Pseudonocardiaceae bacterium]